MTSSLMNMIILLNVIQRSRKFQVTTSLELETPTIWITGLYFL